MDETEYIRRCLDLAALAWPYCRPNPMVGAVLVKDGRILTEGFTQAYGGHHAEVMALSGLEGENLSTATLYVSLEPCSHHGKTPPCADLIVERGVGKVVIGTIDTSSDVAGKGQERLRAAGIEVELSVLEEECREVNRRFFTFQEQKRPYVILKWARSADGFIDRVRDGGKASVISGPLAKQYVHRWRAEEMGILIGGNTYRKDRPRLDVREVEGPDPVPIIWSKSLSPEDLLPHHHGKAILTRSKNVETLLFDLHERGIQSILVEGGAKVLQAFLDSGLYDEVRRLSSRDVIGTGVKEPLWSGAGAEVIDLRKDRLEVWRK